MMSEYAVAVDGVEKRFGDFLVLKGVSLRVARGEVVSVLGPNGAGKTTLLRIVSGALYPSTGNACVLDACVTNNPLRVKSFVGFVPEGPGLFPELSVYQNLWFVGRLHGMKGERLRSAIDSD